MNALENLWVVWQYVRHSFAALLTLSDSQLSTHTYEMTYTLSMNNFFQCCIVNSILLKMLRHFSNALRK